MIWMFSDTPILIRGAGEQASAIAWHLNRAGFPLLMTELPSPEAVRRLVAFSEAVNTGAMTVEGVTARLVDASAADVPNRIEELWRAGEIAVIVSEDPVLPLNLTSMPPTVIIDARMLKRSTGILVGQAPFTLAIGPGIRAGEQVDVVIETQRGHELGRIIRSGEAATDTGIPGNVAGRSVERVHRAPGDGIFTANLTIGELVEAGDLLGQVRPSDGPALEVRARIAGRVRGLLSDGFTVRNKMKLADIDPRGAAVDPATISDKGRTIAAGALTALLEFMSRGGIQCR
ncbi:MAG: EF2563 family selenium-dependent molybdenum hydroxylase system protein [bacterium]|nr:EF2563 family selenium-dependent molybdenum hydroxylase system protein [bacterium]